MAYTINLTDGSIFATIADGTINTSSSMILVGKNYAGYGEFLDENFIHLLENGSNTVAPGAPLTGQLWWDKATGVMNVYNGTQFKTLGGATAGNAAPSGSVTGDLWFNTATQQLNCWNGTSFILIGPSGDPSTAEVLVETIADNLSVDHVIIRFVIESVTLAIMSKDPTFTPQVAITGFATIGPGLNLSTTVSSALFRGTATDSQTLDGLDSTQFMRADAAATNNTSISITNNAGLTVGASNNGRLLTAGNDLFLRNLTSDGNLILQINDGGVNTTVVNVNGATAVVGIPTSASVTGNVTGGNLLSLGIMSSVGNVTAPWFIGNVSGNISGNLTVAGGNTQVLFNDSGVANAVAGMTFEKTSNAFAVSGNVTCANLSVSTGTVSVGSIVNNNANAVGNIGSATRYFNTIFATATTALYADVAERFHADETYLPGTVVELGGPNEITISRSELSENVFGVISTRAAYLMNAGAGTDETHPPVAMTGRVPVRVIGTVRKGDRLVSAGSGLARAAAQGEITAYNVIGRALKDKVTPEEGTVEAIVTIN